MRPDAVYTFEKCPAAPTRFKLIEHTGADVPNFPAVWKVNSPGGKKGEQYVGFRDKVVQKPGGRHWDYAIELWKEKYLTESGKPATKTKQCTGFNFDPKFPGKSCGDYEGYGLLIKFSDDWRRLTIWFFEGMANQKQSLFQKWVAGEMPELAAADTLKLEMKKAG